MNADRWQLLAGAAVLLLALTALQHALAADPGRRNWELFTEMAYGAAGESFMPSDVFADGRTMQPLVAGVVPRGHLPFPYERTPEDAERAGRELVSPFAPDDPAALAAGLSLFAIYCTPCHDARGTGMGNAVLRGMFPPPNLHADRARTMADGQMFHILTLGQGNMASYAAQLPPDERWQVIRHVRQLQEAGP